NRIDIGPPVSVITVTPECGGFSNSFKDPPTKPDVRANVFENTSPGNSVVTTSLSWSPSKSTTRGSANGGAESIQIIKGIERRARLMFMLLLRDSRVFRAPFTNRCY